MATGRFLDKLTFSIKTKIALSNINLCRVKYYNYLKPGQIQCINQVLSNSNDVICVLPTGYGKSLIFEILQKITNSSIILINPLNSIISEQVQRYSNSLCICPDIHSRLQDHEELRQFCHHNYTFYIGHPEHF